MKNMETPAKGQLDQFLQDLQRGRYVIPNFQREFEWSPSDIVELIKSILKDYYIGTLLLWKASKENIASLSCEPIYGFKEKSNPEHIVLDGQQRLAALYYSFFTPEINYPNRSKRCFFFIKLEEWLNKNFDEAVYYEWGYKHKLNFIENTEEQYKNKILPLQIIADRRDGYEDWLDGYEKYWLDRNDKKIIDEKKRIRNEIKEILYSYEISYIELDRDIEVAKVCDIFTKINSTGIKLDIFDLLNAILTPKDIYLKKMWRHSSKELGDLGSEVEAKNILQTMSILKQGYCSPSYLYYLVPEEKKPVKLPDGSIKRTILIKTKSDFNELWNLSVEMIKETLSMISSTKIFGAITSRFVPYPTMIPILAAIIHEKERDIYLDKQDLNGKIQKWYWSSIFTKNYSSSVESQMAKDYTEIKEWFKNDDCVPKPVIQCAAEIGNLNLKDETNQGSAVYRAIFDLLILKGARDWDNFKLPEFSNLHDHHIVPYSWGKRVVDKKINSILNRTPLSDKTNRDVINNQPPNVYIRKIFKKAKDKNKVYNLFESHLISRKAVDILMRDDFSPEDFGEFIKEREKTILSEVATLLELGRYKPRIKDFQIDKKDYKQTIKQGESDYVEFKSSLRWDYEKSSVNRLLEFIVAKTISAFLNSNGGTIFIGVNDDGKILGLKNDYSTLHHKNADGFKIQLTQIINQYLGKEIHEFIQIQIIRLHKREVCIVEVGSSNKPVYLKNEGKEEFFIRASVSSQPLSLREANEYIKTHWEN